jgi:DNA-binding MarR family transcriptional regulator
MDAFPTVASSSTCFGDAPVLVAATSNEAIATAMPAIEAGGFRVGDTMSIELAGGRLDLQGRAAAVWIEVDRDGGGAMDELLTRISRDVADGRYAAVVSTKSAILDAVAAQVGGDVELIVDADEAQRLGALAIATEQHRSALTVRDVDRDRNAERLRQLSEEVSRIASTLARLSTDPVAPQRLPERPRSTETPPLSIETVRKVIRARRLRARYFPEQLFADPAWDMLLDLLQAEIAQLRVPVSSLCIAAAVPATTALRWLKTMVSQGLFTRRSDPHDGRRVFVELAPETSHALRAYFAEVGQVAFI